MSAGPHPTKGAVYTFSECVENHVGMEKISRTPKQNADGTLIEYNDDGLNKQDLRSIAAWFKQKGQTAEIYALHKFSGLERKAHVVLVRNGVDGDALQREIEGKKPDTKFLNKRAKKVQNKHARYNFNVWDKPETQEADFANGKGTVYAFQDMPQLNGVREMLTQIGSDRGGDLKLKLKDLLAEANVYYDHTTGIGFHGDEERKMVIGVNMGDPRYLEFQGYDNGAMVGKRITIILRSGDLYFMSVDACGHDCERHRQEESWWQPGSRREGRPKDQVSEELGA